MNNVQSPKHYCLPVKYKGFPRNDTVNIECLDVIEALGLDKDLFLGSAFQYLWRAGRKSVGTKIEDLEKAVFYIQKAIEREKNEEIPF